MPEDYKEVVGLTQKGVEKGVDKFTINDSLLEEMFNKLSLESGEEIDEKYLDRLRGKIEDAVASINGKTDDLLDISLLDGGEIDVDSKQEIAALEVVRKKVVSKLNTKIANLLGDDIELKFLVGDLMEENELLPPDVVDKIKKAVEEENLGFLAKHKRETDNFAFELGYKSDNS